MARTNFYIIRSLMIKDNSLDSWICETEAEEKRDITEAEENAIWEILSKHDTEGCSVRGTLEDVIEDIK